jgi:hypothetical protein
MPLEIVIVVLIVAAVVVAVPVRRLVLDGYSGGAILAYVALLGLLAAGVTEARTLGRFVLPILGLAYIAPFITVGGGLDRLLGRRRPIVRVTPVETPAIAPPRDVTPRDEKQEVQPPASEAPLDPAPVDDPTEPRGSSDRPGPSA